MGEWHDEEITLLEIYHEIWPEDDATPHITEIGLFSDLDDTSDDSVAWFSYVHLAQQMVSKEVRIYFWRRYALENKSVPNY